MTRNYLTLKYALLGGQHYYSTVVMYRHLNIWVERKQDAKLPDGLGIRPV